MYKVFVALRYLRANKIIYFSIGGVAMGIMVMIIVTSVMGGFSRDIQARVRGLQSHLVIKPVWKDRYLGDYKELIGKLRKVPGVEAAAPRIEYFGAFGWRSEQHIVTIIGIDPEYEKDASDLPKFFARGDKGSFDFKAKEGAAADLPGVVMGSELYPGPDETVYLQTIRQGDQWNYSHDKFTSLGSFKSGMAEYDSQFVLMDLGQMQKFLKLSPSFINTYAIRVKDYEKDGEAVREALLAAIHEHNPCKNPAQHIRSVCGNFRVQSWEEVRSILLQAVAVERGIQVIILFCIVIVAGFNIIAIYTMMVRAKTRDVGILRSLGATRGGVVLIFLISGGLCGLFGSIFGIGAGTIVASYLNEIVSFVRIASRELNALVWKETPPDASVLWWPLLFYVAAFVALVGSWRWLYRPFGGRAWIWTAVAAVLMFGGSLAFYRWASGYQPQFDDPGLPQNLAWQIASIGVAVVVLVTLLRQQAEPWREQFLGGFVRLLGTLIYSAFTIFLIGGIAVSGALLAVRPNFFFRGWDLFPRQIYYLDRVPVLIDPATVVLIVLATLGVSVLFSIYPALRAASTDPIEAIRDE